MPFIKPKDKTEEVNQAWRQALEVASGIAGYDSRNWNNEADLINRIAEDLKRVVLSLPSDDVKIMGIVGPAGSGKTSIARALYNQYSRDFEFSTFIEDIRGSQSTPTLGGSHYQFQLDCQKQLPSQLFNQTDIEVGHLGIVKNRLKDKKVLVVLDEVDCLLQDEMIKTLQGLGPGSRIIIITKDRKLLKKHKINHIYKMKYPFRKKSLQIFCLYAFGQKSPYYGFDQLAWEVTSLAGDRPLGLKVMGSYLRGMSMDEWLDALPRLRSSLDRKIESTLRYCYDVLSDKDKILFLHIACFFVGLEVDSFKSYLSNSPFDVNHGLQILALKSLVWTEYGLLRMPRLLQQMGQEIVYKTYTSRVVPHSTAVLRHHQPPSVNRQ